MANSFAQNSRTALVLLRRDLQGINTKIKDALINTAILAGFELLLYNYFLPFMGMDTALIGPMFIGTIGFILLIAGFNSAMIMLMNINMNGIVSYQSTLPLPKSWLLGVYTTTFALDFTLQAVIPPLLMTFVFLSHMVPLSGVHWPFLLLFHLLAMVTFAVFFLGLSFACTQAWFFTNIWPRVLIPLLLLGAIFYPLNALIAQAPYIGRIAFFNPATYLLEGYRIVLLGTTASPLSLTQCVGALLACLCAALVFLRYSIYKRIDPV